MSILSLFVINGSDIVSQPWNTTFSPYIHILGQGWLIIPLSFLGAALFMKVRDPVILAGYLIITGVMFGATMFMLIGEAAYVYFILTGVGIAVLFFNLFFGGNR